jgi:dienelactone hydrolase
MNFLNEIASHGYMVIATGYYPAPGVNGWKYERSVPEQQTEAIDWIMAQNSDKNSPYFGKINVKKICVAGMSCGGLQTLTNSADPRISTLMIMNSGLFNNSNAASAIPGMPMPSKEKLNEIKVPIIYILGGKDDIAYENGMDDFKRINHVPAIAINYPVGHGGTYAQPHGGEFSIPALAWLNWNLKNDKEAAKMFLGNDCGISQRKDWTIEKNALVDQPKKK